MAGPTTWNVHWRVPFVSLAGRAYNADIYEYGYNGSNVTLKGAPQPFVTQENNDDDIFSAIRAQSGYLRIILDPVGTPSDAGRLEAIVPSNDTEKMIRLTHTEDNATVVDWQGFLQCQIYTQAWSGTAHLVEIPVRSMLATLEHKRVPSTLANSGATRLLNVIVTAFDQLASGFMGGVDSIDAVIGQWMKVMVDWNAFFSTDDENSDGYTTPLQYGISWMEAMEMVCEVFGLMMREHGDRLVIAQYDRAASNLKMRSLTWAQAQSIAAGTTDPAIGSSLPTPTNVTSSATWRGTDNNVNYMPGAKKVEVTFSPTNSGENKVLVMPEQDPSETIEPTELALGDSTTSDPLPANSGRVFVQSYPDRSNDFEIFSYKQWDADHDTYVDSSRAMVLLQSVLSLNGTYTDNTRSGAWPIRYGKRPSPIDRVEMLPGLFLQQIENSELVSLEKDCSEIKSAGHVYLKAGNYINIQMQQHEFKYSLSGSNRNIKFEDSGNGSRNITVFGVKVMVGSMVFNGARTLQQTWNDVVNEDLEHYGTGEWIASGGRDIYSVYLGFIGTDIVCNRVEDTEILSYDGGFLIPITEDMNGVLKFSIRNKVDYYHGQARNSRIITGLKVSILQTAPPFYSETRTNHYKTNLDNGFKREITKKLSLGTCNCNQPSPTLLLKADGDYLRTFDSNKRPEELLQARLAAYYNVARRAFEAEILQGLDIWNRRWQIDGKLYMGVDETHEWDMDRQKVKFIEVTSS